MKTTGIIAEFNPLHLGHDHLLQEARRAAGADYVQVLMSGDFVTVRVTGAKDYDLIGEEIHESAE